MTRIRDRIDQLINILLILGRGANQVALRASGAALEVRTPADTAYADARLKNLRFEKLLSIPALTELRDSFDFDYNDLRLKHLHFEGYTVTGRVFGIQKRQCVASGPVDSAGQPNIISAPGGLNAEINGTSAIPIRCTFAGGSDASGEIDFRGRDYSITENLSLVASTTNYFYLEMNAASGGLTPTRITIAPVYSRVAPTSPAPGLHWFDTSQNSSVWEKGMCMYEWLNSMWRPRRRVFIGEATTNASEVTSFATYAYERRYQSAWTAWTGQQTINLAHNLGMNFADAEATYAGYARSGSNDTNVSLTMHTIGNNTGLIPFGLGNRLNQPFMTGDGGLYYTGSAYVTTGQLAVSIQSGW